MYENIEKLQSFVYFFYIVFPWGKSKAKRSQPTDKAEIMLTWMPVDVRSSK